MSDDTDLPAFDTLGLAQPILTAFQPILNT